MVDIIEVSAVVAAAGVLIGVIYYILDIRSQTKMRHMDLVMRLYSTYYSKEFTEAGTRYLTADFKDYNGFVEKYGSIPSENPVQIAFSMVATFFEGVGELLHKKLIDIELVEDLFAVEVYWTKAEPLVKELRKQFHPKMYEWFEYLFNEIEKREQQAAKTI